MIIPKETDGDNKIIKYKRMIRKCALNIIVWLENNPNPTEEDMIMLKGLQAKLKEKLKVANRKSEIAEKKLDSFKDKHSKVINEYRNLELDAGDKATKCYDISEDINEYENKFNERTYDWVD